MLWLIIGLILFLGVHSIRLGGDGLRGALVARVGVGRYKGLYSLVSATGLGLIIFGFSRARVEASFIYLPRVGGRHAAMLFTWAAFVSLSAAYISSNHIGRWVRHPMTIGVLLWASGHLLANGALAEVVLFGSFALWSALLIAVAWKRELMERPQPRWSMTLATLGGGTLAWGAFALWLHAWLIGPDIL